MAVLQSLRVKGNRGVSYPNHLEQIHFLEYYSVCLQVLNKLIV